MQRPEKENKFKMANNSTPQFPVLLPLLYALILGVLGFACGFFGNALLAERPGNMAPIRLGIL